MKEWKNKAAPLQEWLKKEETKTTQYETISDNHEELTVTFKHLQVEVFMLL